MGCSLFLVASRFNHACKERNNVEYSYDFDKRCMAFVTKKRITEGSELFIRYSNDPKHLYAIWGFRCACGGCKGISEDACKAIGPFPWGEIETNDWN
jgi:SET domain-containing protein